MDDASYKRLLGHERIVKDLLIGFIAPRRPAGWAETLDFDSLSEGPTESINDGPAQLALSYDVVDLMAVGRDDLPRPNLLTWVAEVEQSVHAGTLRSAARRFGSSQVAIQPQPARRRP